MQTEPRRRRRLLQFSLRGLLLLVLLVAVFFGGRASVSHLIEAERKARKEAEQAALMLLNEVNEAEAQQQVIEQLRQVERQAWQNERANLESLDRTEAAVRRKQELDRIREAMEQEELQKRLEATGIQLP